MDFLVLGPVEVRRAGRPVDLGGLRQRAVLARLIAARGDAVPVDRLIEDLWAGEPTASALSVLQAYVSNLRRLLEPERAPRTPATLLVTRAPGYALMCPSDADEFGQRLDDGVRALGQGDAAAAARSLDEALALWRGGAYADLADQDWARPEITRLDELRLIAREHRCAAALALGQAHAATPELEGLVAEYPLREGLWRLLALAMYRTGRQADALATLRKCQDTLRDELGLDPAPVMQELERAILSHDPGLGDTVQLSTRAAALRPAAPAEAAAVGVPSTVLLGRAAPLAELRRAAASAAASTPGSVLVTGEAGIGKSRLVASLVAELESQDWQVAWGRCHDTSGSPALWPWLQVLADLDEADALPSGVRVLLEGEYAGHTDAADARFRQHSAIRRYLLDSAQRKPLLVVLEDLQWADAASVQLLADTADLARAGRLLIVATTRPPQSGGDPAALVRLDRAGGRRLALGGLDAAALQAMADAAGQQVPGSVLLARTGGNPFIARETLRLIEQIGIERALSRVPDSVGDLVRQRLAVLPEQVRGVLEVAAVFGRDLDIDAVAAAGGQAGDDVWDAVDTAVQAGILVERPGGGLGFSHDLLRETLYADLPPLRRSRVHAKVVDVLQRRPAPDAFRLAEHAYAAGPVARPAATRWCVAAAEQAEARLAYHDAVRWWGRAAQSQQRDPTARPELRLDLLMSLLHAQLNTGDAIGARETRNQALTASDALHDDAAGQRALLALHAPALWLLRQFNEVELDLVGRLEHALAEPDPGDSERRCRLLATLAMELYDAVEDPRCAELSAAALKMARRLGDPAVIALALNARYLANNRDAVASEKEAIGTELIGIGIAGRRPPVTLLGHALVAHACLHTGDMTRADEHADEAERLNRRLDLQLPRMQSVAYRIGRLQLDGRFEESAAKIEEFAALKLSWWAMDGLLATMWLNQWFIAGELDRVTDDLLQRAARARPAVSHDIALLAADGPRGDGIGLRSWTRAGRDWGWLTGMQVRAEAVSRYGTREACAAVYADLSPYAGRFAYSSGFAMPVDWGLARLSSALGDHSGARRHLRSLETSCVRESLRWWADRARSALLASSKRL